EEQFRVRDLSEISVEVDTDDTERVFERSFSISEGCVKYWSLGQRRL
ncbi:unnamed protein product, partial [marine sediment metagenome]